MEWALLLLFALLAAALVGLPRASAGAPEGVVALEGLREERQLLLAELRDLDEDAAAGRISSADRVDGRRALAPRLRTVTARLRAASVERDRAGESPAPTGEGQA